MEKIKKYVSALKLLFGLDWAVLDELEELSQRVSALEAHVLVHQGSIRSHTHELATLRKVLQEVNYG